MKPSALKERTKRFSVAVIKLVETLPRNLTGDTIAGPLIRSGTAVGSCYRNACKSQNHYDFLARLNVIAEAADESCYWMEVIVDSQALPTEQVQPLLEEGRRLKKIFVKSRKIAQKRQREEMGKQGRGYGDEDIPF